jgi:heptosyltransferase-3
LSGVENLLSREFAVQEHKQASIKRHIDLQGKPPQRVLACKLGRFGDVLMMTPFCKALKDLFPQVKITALVYRDTREMVSNCPYVDDWLLVDNRRGNFGAHFKKGLQLLRQIRQRHFDLYFDFSNGERGAYLGFLSGIKRHIGFTRPSTTWLHILIPYLVPRRQGYVHEVVNYLEQLEVLGLRAQPGPLQWRPDPASLAQAEAILANLGIDQFALVHPTSFWMFKAWSEEKNAAIIDYLNRQGLAVLLSAGPAAGEKAYAQGIMDKLKCPQKTVNLAGQLSLSVLGALIGKARLFFGADSAPMHLAAAMGTPCAAIFGPSSEVSWHPWMTPHRVIAGPCPERPCHRAGCNDSGKSLCLENLDPSPVIAAIAELLAESSPCV